MVTHGERRKLQVRAAKNPAASDEEILENIIATADAMTTGSPYWVDLKELHVLCRNGAALTERNAKQEGRGTFSTVVEYHGRRFFHAAQNPIEIPPPDSIPS